MSMKPPQYKYIIIIIIIIVIVINVAIVIFFRVTLEDLYNGKSTKLQLSKNVICAVCKGYVEKE